MVVGYSYDVWNGKEVIGKYFSSYPIYGKTLIIPTVSPLKEEYGKKYETIKVPMIVRCIYNDQVETRLRWALDVRKKSQRQIKIILGR